MFACGAMEGVDKVFIKFVDVMFDWFAGGFEKMVDDIANFLEVRLVETLLNEMLFGCRNREFDLFVGNKVIVNVCLFFGMFGFMYSLFLCAICFLSVSSIHGVGVLQTLISLRAACLLRTVRKGY